MTSTERQRNRRCPSDSGLPYVLTSLLFLSGNAVSLVVVSISLDCQEGLPCASRETPVFPVPFGLSVSARVI